MKKALIRPLMIFVPMAVGFCFPAARCLAEPPWNIIRYCLMIMIFSSCLQLQFRDLKLRREHGRLAAANLLVGMAAWGLCRGLLPQYPALAHAVFFAGIAPTAAAAPVVVSFLRGNIGFALTGFCLNTCCVALVLPLLLPLVVGEFSMDFMLRVGETLIWVLVVPFAAAMLCRRWFPRAGEMVKRGRTAVFTLWSCSLFVLAATARQYFIDHPETPLRVTLLIAGASLVLCAVNFQLGRYLTRGPYRMECGQLLGQKNTVLMICLALQYAGALAAIGPVFYILWHNIWNAWQMYVCDRNAPEAGRRD